MRHSTGVHAGAESRFRGEYCVPVSLVDLDRHIEQRERLRFANDSRVLLSV